MTDNEEEINLSEADLSAFADKLDTWGESLPADEKALLQYVLARAEGPGDLVTESDEEMNTSATPGELAEALLRPAIEQGLSTKSGETRGLRRNCTWSTWSRGIPPI